VLLIASNKLIHSFVCWLWSTQKLLLWGGVALAALECLSCPSFVITLLFIIFHHITSYHVNVIDGAINHSKSRIFLDKWFVGAHLFSVKCLHWGPRLVLIRRWKLSWNSPETCRHWFEMGRGSGRYCFLYSRSMCCQGKLLSIFSVQLNWNKNNEFI